MTEKLFLNINASTRVTYDPHQWIVQTKKEAGARWREKAFVASNFATLMRVLDEMGVRVPKKAKATLPPSEGFQAWYAKET